MEDMKQGETRTGSFHTRENRLAQQEPTIEWQEPPKRKVGEHLLQKILIGQIHIIMLLCIIIHFQRTINSISELCKIYIWNFHNNRFLQKISTCGHTHVPFPQI